MPHGRVDRTRSEWDPESLIEQPYDTKRIKQRFEDANAGLPSAMR